MQIDIIINVSFKHRNVTFSSNKKNQIKSEYFQNLWKYQPKYLII